MRVSNLRSHNILHKKKNPNLCQQEKKNFLNVMENCKFFLSKNINIDSFSKFNDSRNVHCENMIANKIRNHMKSIIYIDIYESKKITIPMRIIASHRRPVAR